MGKKHDSQYANFGWLLHIRIIQYNRTYLFVNLSYLLRGLNNIKTDKI